MNLNTFAFILSVIGIFLLLGLSPFSVISTIKSRRQKDEISKSMAEIVKEAKAEKKEGYLTKLFRETKDVLRIMNKTATFNFLLILSIIFFIIGVCAALLVNNIFLIPVLAIGLSLAPFYYIKFTEGRFLKLLNEELETSLGVITTSYQRGNNTFIGAVEENLPYLMPPVCYVFESFIYNVKHVTPNTKEALELMKRRLSNLIFCEWVDAVILCQDNHNLKPTLMPIVRKLSDLRSVDIEMENIMYPPLYEYICMVLLTIGIVPILYMINKDWFNLLVGTVLGKALITICAATIFVSATFVIKHVKPITYQNTKGD